MKLINRLLVAALFIGMCFSAQAQNVDHPMGISFKALLMDYQSPNGGSIANLKDYHYGFEIGWSKSLQEKINLVVPLKIGVVNSTPFDEDRFDQGRCLHKTVYGLDAQIQYQFYEKVKQVVPFVKAGLGFVGENEGEFNLQAPLGGGFQFKVAENAYILLESEYRISFSADRSNLHHGLGFVYLVGGNNVTKPKVEEKLDSDMDGVLDEDDLCPLIAGLAELNGCPDADGDGVADYLDKCPSVAGLASLSGCPDSDGDGISDNDDDCPTVAGPAEYNGCPGGDRDNDGIPDAEDRCPDLAGIASNGGCPGGDRDNDGVPDAQDLCPDVRGAVSASGCPDRDGDGIVDSKDSCPNTYGPAVYNGCPDTDGDGIDDGRDRCPNTPGPVSTNGCPEISTADKETLNVAMRAVQFDTGRSTLKSESFGVLRQIADIMRRYPDYNLVVSGHTDNTGSAPANQKLSERRAKACYEYLITQGISQSRLNYAGYGESRPISDNNSLRGRSLNRRVEFSLVPSNG